MYQSLNLTITGVSPLLMHNGQLVDPLNSFSRGIARVAGKRGKTEADHEELGRLEFFGGLYLYGGAPCIPGENVEAMLIEAAKKKRRGNQAKAGILCDRMYPVAYDGPRDPQELWLDERFRFRVPVRVQRARIIRTRPIFRKWHCDLEIKYDPAMLDEHEVREFVTIAGDGIGLGDWRPRFGRFVIE